MGKPSRDKGKRGEREVASLLRSYGYDAHRGQQFHGGKESPDVVGLPGIHIEVKRTEAFRLWDALSQAKTDAGDKMPIVVHRKNDLTHTDSTSLLDAEFPKNKGRAAGLGPG